MIHFGVVGTGFIVSGFISAGRLAESVSFDAVYSRKEETGQAFARENKLEKVYTDYEAMLKDSSLDAIYIASPNSLHYAQAKQALLAGKHVFLEKPFTGNLEKAKELVMLAKEKSLILMEAICNIHMPHYQLLKEKLSTLGTLRLVHCNYSQYSSRYDLLLAGETTNVFDPNFSGGALADINIYNVHFVVGLFGKPKSVVYDANCHENGIDTSGVLTLDYGSFKAVLIGAKDSFSESYGFIQGEKGYAKVVDGTNRFSALEWHSAKHSEVDSVQDKPRLYYQVEVFVKMVLNHDYALRDLYLDESLMVVAIAEEARKQIGLEFDN